MTGILQGLLASIGVAQIPFMYSWGSNGQGQLGSNNRTYRSSPVQVDNEEWTVISCAGNGVAAIKADGTLWTWGYNARGQLGQNDRVTRSSPTQVGSLMDWSSVSATMYAGACVAVRTDGSLWTWGPNPTGQLGQGDETDRSSPTQVGGLLTWAKVSGGTRAGAAIKTDNSLWIWGNNGNGQLGQGTTGVPIKSPVQITGSWSSVALGDNGEHAIRTNGALFAWGFPGQGQLGTNSYVQFTSPVQIGSLLDWSFVSANGTGLRAALKTDNTLWVWGYNGTNGSLGLGSAGSGTNRSSPTQLGSAEWSQVSASYQMGGIKTNKTLWTWGRNGDGQLGLSDVNPRSSPTQVGSGNWSKIASSPYNFMFGVED